MFNRLAAVMTGLAMMPIAFGPCPARAASPTTLYTFSGGTDGAFPIGGLVLGKNGNYYGTTALGGSGCSGFGCGTIFQLAPPSGGSTKWVLTTLYTFIGGTDGQEPVNLIADSSGNLYGAAQYGGVSPVLCTVGGTVLGCGTIFELSPPSPGQSNWAFATLYAFTGGNDGEFPNYGITMDTTGAIYGEAFSGGSCAAATCGTVFKLTPPASGQTTWTFATLHDFAGGADGTAPYGIPYVDATGAVYGTTSAGGSAKKAPCVAAGGCGLVFQLTPPAAGKTAWTKKTIWAFTGADGIYPEGGLIADTAGNLYGTADLGGNLTACNPGGGIAPGCGTVYELTPPAAGATAWTRKVIYTFTAGADGLYPAAALTLRTNLFTTTSGNGTQGLGSVVKLVAPKSGKGAWAESTLFDFTNDANGAQPVDALLLNGATFYGTTLGHDGTAPGQYGTIFSIAP